MTTLNSGLHFLSGIMINFGMPVWIEAKLHKRTSRKSASKRRRIKRLTTAEQRELLRSIRHDDWLE